jgi:hypothetical protein
VVERRWASAPCKARAATKVAADTDQRSSAFRFLFLSSYIVAQGSDREATGHHRRHSLTKIERRAKRLSFYLLRVTMTRVRIASRERSCMSSLPG